MAPSIADPFVAVAAGALAFAIAAAGARIAANAKFLPDQPNARSSHEKVTSKAGGLAIAGGWAAAVLVLIAFGVGGEDAVLGARLILLAALALLIGVSDDHWSAPAALKFAGQLILAALFVALFGPLSSLALPIVGEVALPAFVGAAFSVFWIVAFMNAFNFMDGANGLASGAAGLGLSVFALAAAFVGAQFLGLAATLLVIAIFAFFLRNFLKGDIFMGDGGSQTVGFLIAAFALIAAESHHLGFYFIPTIFLALIFDVTFTLAHRTLRGARLAEAHREHLYQLLLRAGRSHRDVAILYMTATGFASAAALFMLTVPPGWSWLFPACVAALMFGPALALYGQARRLGFFPSRKNNAPPPQAVRATDVSTSSASAME